MTEAEHSAENDAPRCEVPLCQGIAVGTAMDSADPPRTWRVCADHLRVIRPRVIPPEKTISAGLQDPDKAP